MPQTAAPSELTSHDLAGYADTHYTRTRQVMPVLPALSGPVEADVCVVGGGIAGISAAWQLQARGLSVVLLEAQRLAWGASGRNGGQLSAGFATGMGKVAARSDPETARGLYALSREGVQIVLDHIRDLALPGVDPVPGIIAASRHPDAAGMQADQAAARALGHEKQYLTPRDLRDLIHTERYYDGLLDPEARHIHPMNYCLGLAADFLRSGGQVFENTPVTSVGDAGRDKVVQTAGGQVTAPTVVLCGSGYSGPVFGQLRRSLLPIGTYVASTHPLGPGAAAIMSTAAAVVDTRLTGDYFRLLPDGSLLWGGGMSATAPAPADLPARMQARIRNVFPQLGDVELRHVWSGLMGYAAHKMPYLQQLDPGVWTLTALGGHGLNTGPALGRVLAEAIAEGGRRHELFRPFGLRWNGGPFGPYFADAVAATANLSARLHER